jgi:hypothetical protein
LSAAIALLAPGSSPFDLQARRSLQRFDGLARFVL